MGKAKQSGKQTELTVLTPLFEPLAALQRLLHQFNSFTTIVISGIYN